MNKMTITLLVNAIEIENADYAIKRQIKHMENCGDIATMQMTRKIKVISLKGDTSPLYHLIYLASFDQGNIIIN